MTVLAYVPDLLDRSRLTGAGKAVRFVSSPADLPEAAAAGDVHVVVVDLSRPGVLEAVASVAAAGVRTVGFGSHVDADLLQAAREAGCDDVLPRSRFFARVADHLA